MQALRSLGLVKGVPGPRGGYKPTIKAYYELNIPVIEKGVKVPIYKNGREVENLSVLKIEFTSIPHPGECEAVIKVMGDIKKLELGDKIRVGPTPVNKLTIDGIVVGRDDLDNVILLDTESIRSIPKKKVIEVGSQKLITLKPEMDVRTAAKILSENKIDGAPVVSKGKVVGIVTLTDIVNSVAKKKEKCKISEIMSKRVITVEKDTNIYDAINIMTENNIGRLIIVDNGKPVGIVTRTDILTLIAGLKS